MTKECYSGVGTPNISLMKGRYLTLAKRRLYKNKFHGIFLKAPVMVLSKV